MGAVNKAWTRRPAWPRLFIFRYSKFSFLEIQKFQNSDYLRRFLLLFLGPKLLYLHSERRVISVKFHCSILDLEFSKRPQRVEGFTK